MTSPAVMVWSWRGHPLGGILYGFAVFVRLFLFFLFFVFVVLFLWLCVFVVVVVWFVLLVAVVVVFARCGCAGLAVAPVACPMLWPCYMGAVGGVPEVPGLAGAYRLATDAAHIYVAGRNVLSILGAYLPVLAPVSAQCAALSISPRLALMLRAIMTAARYEAGAAREGTDRHICHGFAPFVVYEFATLFTCGDTLTESFICNSF